MIAGGIVVTREDEEEEFLRRHMGNGRPIAD
jgi:hypothetical protein